MNHWLSYHLDFLVMIKLWKIWNPTVGLITWRSNCCFIPFSPSFVSCTKVHTHTKTYIYIYILLDIPVENFMCGLSIKRSPIILKCDKIDLYWLVKVKKKRKEKVRLTKFDSSKKLRRCVIHYWSCTKFDPTSHTHKHTYIMCVCVTHGSTCECFDH